MRDLAKSLLGLGITIGLSDREKFVKQVSSIIQEYQKDPEKAQKWAQAAIAYLENMKDNINMQNAIKGVVGDNPLPDKKQIEELTNAIKELTKELQQMPEKK
jgi:hypothetical protein